MIIAIDETGTFSFTNDANLRHFFLASFFLENGNLLKTKKEQFEKWEATISEKKKERGEIKGYLLDTQDLGSFVQEVVCTKPEIRFSCVSVVPKALNLELLKKHKNFEVRLIAQSLKQETWFPRKDKNFIEQYAKWLKKRNEVEFLKMFCLKHCLMDSLKNAFGYAIITDNEMELLDVGFKVDADFINNENIYWNEYLLKSIEQNSEVKPFPILDTWDDNHPITKKYIINGKKGKGINLRTVYEGKNFFMDSKENFEIRITDIAAIIFNRYFNRSSSDISKVFSLIEKKAIIGDYHIELRLNNFDEEGLFLKITGLPLEK
ncbi:MAG: DUF3800 domain-containing protein [Bacteroidota bacterium]